MPPVFPHVSILGVKVDDVSSAELVCFIKAAISECKKVTVSYVNIHALNIAYSDPIFRKYVNNSELTFCDGFGVKLGMQLIGQPFNSRLTPPDFMDMLAHAFSDPGYKMFFLGARPGIAQDAANQLKARYPGLVIGAHHGYFDKSKDSPENRDVIEKINTFRPNLLAVGFGMPLQEKWIAENFDDLEINVAFPVGALFDYLSGRIVRAPRWMTDNGFEWLGRLVIEPQRLWKRYIIGNPLFFWRIIKHHYLNFPLPH